MQDNVQEKTQKPVLDIFKEMAEARGLTLEEFTDSFGYTPKIVEAMEQHPWFQTSLAILDALHEKYEVSREECQAMEHCGIKQKTNLQRNGQAAVFPSGLSAVTERLLVRLRKQS